MSDLTSGDHLTPDEQRIARLIAELPGTEELETPSTDLRDRILEQVASDRPILTVVSPTTAPSVTAPTSPTGPRRAAEPAPARISRRGALGLAVGGVAAGLLGGVLAGWAIATRQQQPTLVSSVALDSLDGRVDLGRAELLRAGDRLELRVELTDAPSTSAQEVLQIWLINSDGQRLLPIGQYAGGPVTLAVGENELADGYTIVDVSLEALDGDTGHSGRTIVRGTLPW